MSGQKIYKYPCQRHEGIFGEFLPSAVDRLSGERLPLAAFFTGNNPSTEHVAERVPESMCTFWIRGEIVDLAAIHIPHCPGISLLSASTRLALFFPRINSEQLTRCDISFRT